jgi:hypothetical protein
MVEGDHESDDNDSLFEHKHRKIRKTLSHISKSLATNNFKILTPWILLNPKWPKPKHRA